jgi:hypothetical protein
MPRVRAGFEFERIQMMNFLAFSLLEIKPAYFGGKTRLVFDLCDVVLSRKRK